MEDSAVHFERRNADDRFCQNKCKDSKQRVICINTIHQDYLRRVGLAADRPLSHLDLSQCGFWLSIADESGSHHADPFVAVRGRWIMKDRPGVREWGY